MARKKQRKKKASVTELVARAFRRRPGGYGGGFLSQVSVRDQTVTVYVPTDVFAYLHALDEVHIVVRPLVVVERVMRAGRTLYSTIEKAGDE